MNLLDKKFKTFLAKEGLSPKSQETYDLLRRAYYSGATDFYHATTNAVKEAKLNNPDNEEKRSKAIKRAVSKLTSSITQYWKEQLAKAPQKSFKANPSSKTTNPKLKIVKK